MTPTFDGPVPSVGQRPRTLHLVDLENLLGNPFETSRERVARCLDDYRQSSGWNPTHQSLLAVNRWLLRTHFDLLADFGGRLYGATGPDGADRRLLTMVDRATLSRAFQRLVIGSGDGAFATVADSARRTGAEVDVVARLNSLATRLRVAATRIVELGSPTTRRAQFGPASSLNSAGSTLMSHPTSRVESMKLSDRTAHAQGDRRPHREAA